MRAPDRAFLLLARAARRLMIRTGRGPAREIWRLAYGTLLRLLVAVLKVASAETVYVRGSFGAGEPVYGLSDVDLIAVARPGAPCERLRRRVVRWYGVFPSSRDAVEVAILDRDHLEEACVSPFMTFPWDPSAGRAVPRARYYGRRAFREPLGPRLEGGLKLYGPGRVWKPLARRDPVALLPRSPDHFRWLWGWSELQFIWKCAYRTCASRSAEHAAYFSTKMVAEPARIWLWLDSGTPPPARVQDVLAAAVPAMPEEEPILQRALALRHSLPSAAEAPLAESLAFLCRVSMRIADRLAETGARAELTRITLEGDDGDGPHRHPLADWRSCVLGDAFEDEFTLVDGSPDDPAALATVALSSLDGPYRAMRAGRLLVFPTARTGLWPLARTGLRAVQCPSSDPVSFALIEGHRVAEFPELAGWSARERAERGVLEHQAWLAADERSEPDARRRLGMLFSAARAAQFARSVAAGDARLTLCPAATVAGYEGPARMSAEAAYEEYETSRARRRPPTPAVAAPFRRVVETDLEDSLSGF